MSGALREDGCIYGHSDEPDVDFSTEVGRIYVAGTVFSFQPSWGASRFKLRNLVMDDRENTT